MVSEHRLGEIAESILVGGKIGDRATDRSEFQIDVGAKALADDGSRPILAAMFSMV